MYWCLLDTLHQFPIDFILAEQVGIAGDEELLAGAGEGNVQFAVYQLAVGLGGDGEDVQLIGLAHGGAVDDDVALAALVTFYGVDGDGLSATDVQGGQFVGNHGYLVAEGYDDAYSSGGIKGDVILLAKLVDSLYQSGGYVCLVSVYLIGIFGRGIGGIDETESPGGNQSFVSIIGVVMLPFEWSLLVCNGHNIEPPAIEVLVGKVADGRVHTSLTVQHGVCAVALLSGIEAFEERVAAIGQSDGM